MSPSPDSEAPADDHPDDHIIRREELAFIREHLAALGERQHALDAHALALVAACGGAPMGSPTWAELLHENVALCQARNKLLAMRRYWVDVYLQMRQQRNVA
jgi:hypothetical protein